jgi:small subunit ribosomal protein S20
MPNIKSAEKRVKVIATKTLQNQMIKSKLKTTLKSFDQACLDANKESLPTAFAKTIKTIDQACAKTILKKNTASRKKSAVTKKYTATMQG